MKIQTASFSVRTKQATTLIEISLVIALLLVLATVLFNGLFPIADWQKAKDAGISLQSVYTAQKTYLADHPTKDISTLTSAELIPYLPNNMTAIPTAVAPSGAVLTIKFTQIPPILMQGGSVFTDTSGKSNDGLWDAGKL